MGWKFVQMTPDYSQLEALLARRKWKQADEETLHIMKQVVGRVEPEDYLSKEDFESFPCDVLQEIDKLWTKHSNNHFGFSVQIITLKLNPLSSQNHTCKRSGVVFVILKYSDNFSLNN